MVDSTLQFGGDYIDPVPSYPGASSEEATKLKGIFAIDAIDGRNYAFDYRDQLKQPVMLREVNKALAGLTPGDPVVSEGFRGVAAGNW